MNNLQKGTTGGVRQETNEPGLVVVALKVLASNNLQHEPTFKAPILLHDGPSLNHSSAEVGP